MQFLHWNIPVCYTEECWSVFSNVMYRFIHTHQEKKRSITIGKHLLCFHCSLLRRWNQIKQIINSGKMKGMNKFEAHLLWNMYIEDWSILYSYSFCSTVSMRQHSSESKQNQTKILYYDLKPTPKPICPVAFWSFCSLRSLSSVSKF